MMSIQLTKSHYMNQCWWRRYIAPQGHNELTDVVSSNLVFDRIKTEYRSDITRATGNSDPVDRSNNQKNNVLHYWPIVLGIHRWPVDFLHTKCE